MPSCQAHATAAPLPFSDSTSVDASLHTLCGGRQSSCFTSPMLTFAGAARKNKQRPLPLQLRIVTLIELGGAAAAAAGGCILQV